MARPDDRDHERLAYGRSTPRSDASVERCVSQALARTGRIDVVVNNAGIEQIGVAEEMSIEDARSVFETNFFGVVRGW